MLVIKSPHLFFPLTFFKLQHMLAHSPLSSMYEPTTTRSYTPPLANFQRLTKMTLKLFSVPPILIIFIFFQFSFSTSDVNPDQYLYESCANTFSCGSLTGITYPFSGNTVPAYCGYPNLNLNCKDNVTTIEINNMRYRVLGINQSTETMRIAREDLMESSCPQDLANTTLNNSLFQFSSNYNIVTFLYNCPNSYTYSDDSGSYSSTPSDSSNLDTVPSCAGYDMVYYVTGDKNPLGCNKSVMVPVYGSVDIGNWTKLEEGIRAGFDIKLKLDQKACHECTESKGRCGFNVVNNRTACYCSTTPFVTDTICSVAVKAPTSPPVLLLPDKGSSSGTQLKLAVSIAGAVLALFGIGLGIFAVKKRRNRANSIKSSQSDSKDNAFSSISKGLTFTTTPSVNFSQSVPSYTSSKLDSSKSSSYFGVQVFTYTELEEATNNFDKARELGEGGFGTVYYGKLKDNRIVAVKRLYENNYKRIEQFMNELDILTRLRHDNLVTLYGCTSRRSRELLLVYEYIPNGTVADHLYGKGSNTASLTWLTRLKIAFETADALAYLHKSDIIHRDVKTNNILLDEDFQVKVADFGLSRLFPTDVTHVSTAPQGTPGYVDPEYHNCYQLTEKSDVYSFGVVLIELISSKQAVDTNRNRLDINLANMAINRIQNGTLGDLVDTSLGFDTDSSVRRMITLVAELAFRCLQTERDMRPSMVEVLKALKRIKDGKLSEQREEVVEIVIEDDVALLKGRSTPVSPRSQ